MFRVTFLQNWCVWQVYDDKIVSIKKSDTRVQAILYQIVACTRPHKNELWHEIK